MFAVSAGAGIVQTTHVQGRENENEQLMQAGNPNESQM